MLICQSSRSLLSSPPVFEVCPPAFLLGILLTAASSKLGPLMLLLAYALTPCPLRVQCAPKLLFLCQPSVIPGYLVTRYLPSLFAWAKRFLGICFLQRCISVWSSLLLLWLVIWPCLSISPDRGLSVYASHLHLYYCMPWNLLPSAEGSDLGIPWDKG